jgi:hypothetical protein
MKILKILSVLNLLRPRKKKIKKPFARKIQILTVGEQRAKVMGKTEVANIFKKGKISIRRTRKK